MRMNMPALDHLMGAYLHQDYVLFGETPMAAVSTFLIDEPDLAGPLVNEVEQLLSTVQDDSDIEETLRAMGCQIRVDSATGSYRTWLVTIAEKARATQTP